MERIFRKNDQMRFRCDKIKKIVAWYFYLEYNKAKTFIDVEKLPSSKGLSQLKIFVGPEWRKSGANGLA